MLASEPDGNSRGPASSHSNDAKMALLERRMRGLPAGLQSQEDRQHHASPTSRILLTAPRCQPESAGPCLDRCRLSPRTALQAACHSHILCQQSENFPQLTLCVVQSRSPLARKAGPVEPRITESEDDDGSRDAFTMPHAPLVPSSTAADQQVPRTAEGRPSVSPVDRQHKRQQSLSPLRKGTPRKRSASPLLPRVKPGTSADSAARCSPP